MPFEDQLKATLITARDWYESHRNKKGGVNTNVMTSGIAVAELLRTQYPLDEKSVKSEKNSQVKGLSGKMIKNVLLKHSEDRAFTSEGGRTSRGTLVLATELSKALTKTLELFSPSDEEREFIADALQQYFVECVQVDYFDKKKIGVVIDYEKPVSAIVSDILASTKLRADLPAGVVAQHLVGAKLELRFPQLEVGRDKANAADQQTNRQGDFQLGTTAFHVTVAPSAKLADRARENIRQGYRPIMLVPEVSVSFALGLFKSEGLADRVGVQSIESFVGTNIEEIAEFSSGAIRIGVARLIRKYNERIKECEVDQSLGIEEPAWMISLLDLSYMTGEF